MLSFRYAATLLLLTTSVHAADPAPAPAAGAAGSLTASPAAAPNDWVAAKLRAAVLEAEPRISEGKPMEPWQKRIFEDEAAPQYLRFVRDYRASLKHSGSAANSVVADLDLDSLKNYLRFYAPAAPMAVLLKPAADCEKCADADAALRKLVRMRLERRGFALTYLAASDLGPEAKSLSGKALEERLVTVAAARNLGSQFLLEWAPVPVDDLDSAHADEKRFYARAVVLAKGFSRAESRQEIQEVDPFETMVGKMLADAFTDLGVQVAAKAHAVANPAVAAAANDAPELELEIRGVQSFAQHAALRAAVIAKLGGPTQAAERKVARGRLVIGVPLAAGRRGVTAAEEIKAQVAGLAIAPEAGGGKLAFVSVAGTSEDPLLVMEVRP